MVSNALGLTQPSIKPDVSAVWQENGEQSNLLSSVLRSELNWKWPKSLNFQCQSGQKLAQKTNLVALFSLLLLEKPRWLPFD